MAPLRSRYESVSPELPIWRRKTSTDYKTKKAIQPRKSPKATLTAPMARSRGGYETASQNKFYDDRRYGAEDPEGHCGYVAQHVRDVAPEDMKPPA